MSRVDGRAPRPVSGRSAESTARDRSGSDRSGSDRRGSDRRGSGRSAWVVGLLVLGVVLAVLLVPRGDDEDTAVRAETERLEQEFAERDRVQIEAITDTARTVAQGLGTVLLEARATLPDDLPGGEGGTLADEATVEDWSARLDELVAAFGEPQSAGTSVNVARGALTTAVDAVRVGTAAYGDALVLDGRDRAAALARAAESFDLGRRIWNVAAIQVDDANVQAGLGHQHVVLAGETPPDSLPEGADAD